MLRVPPAVLGALIVALLPAERGAAQGGGPSPVGVTEARQAEVRGFVKLPGTVAARTGGVIAAEVSGLVVEMLAREGERVARGEPILRLRRVNQELQLRESRARLAEAEARLSLAKGRLARSRELFDSGVISRQDLDDAVTESDAWQGRADETAAEIARLELAVDRSTVKAPFAGVIVAEHTDLGEWVDIGGPVVELLDLDDLEVIVEVPEHHYAGATVGTAARVTFPSLPDLEVDGKISAVIPRADPQARTFPVKVRMRNRGGRAGVGMLADVELPSGQPQPATVVPKDAVVARGRARFLYAVRPAPEGDGETVEQIAIEVGASVGEWVAIRGVEPGERVVTRGNERLQPGQPVAAEPVAYHDAP